MTILPAGAVEGGEQHFPIERDREVIIVQRHAQPVPAIGRDLGLGAVDAPALAANEQEQVDAMLESVRAYGVIAVGIAQADRDTGSLRRSGNNLQTNAKLDVFR